MGELGETSPMLPNKTRTRMSYSHAAYRSDDSLRSNSNELRRAHSVPVLTRRDLRMLSLSPMFYNKLYMTEGGSMVSSAFNLASATCGAGVLALPYAMQHCGTLTGTLTLLVVCTLTIYSVFLLTKVSALTKLMTYEELAMDLVGPIAEKLTALVIVVFCWGVAVMYVVVMGDFVVPLIHAAGLSHIIGRRFAMLIFWAFIMFPLSLARKINTLRYASIVGTVSTLLLAGGLIVRFAEEVLENEHPSRVASIVDEAAKANLTRWDAGTLGALATFVFSYCCQPVAPKIYEELQDRSVQRMCLCAFWSMSTCTLVYITTGVFGAMSFGGAINPNVLVNFADHLSSPTAQVAYLGMVVAVTMAFPMTIFPTRDSVVMALGYRADENPVPDWLSSTIAGLLALLALLIGLAVPNIRVLFDLLGGVCGGSLSFVLPALFALRSGYWSLEAMGWRHLTLTWATLIFGVLVCSVGTYNSIESNFF
ncbi:putative mitochondrial Amino acid permease-like protein [Leptomonas pyrrhocoris]|uniref:Putative mitochondrial Amino acid permease-like protein n=1 Tax=Leptomonas pyrrhocoris TaxID=157538 RepID=A0A0M9G0U0_LEPPY|nr:putative mitochondrial Amino acid permease-like protein [Leptomonas pyrrhocoris]XP_015658316.1 putative mitochondrial Amino acid permease-like protein [Leptomonas pyrrhocoris]KPA79876.1 putative mitochondrial Amino acid permease-like protein [Leptomonas pyrrhocoris]KPA79877.1 putative mitochondrial Amino acid permease-like protein [Leptomonas pyrrhocoris]|eukprot:XP_015658315.1 putative mitochondrial Amino acid permease-like protein [Leptomonas pyrrhocoris]